MGFTWTPITANQTKIQHAHYKELKQNIDVVLQDLQTSYTWNYWANPDDLLGQMVRKPHIEELRAAIDYADDQNYCRAHDAAQYDVYDNNVHTAVDSGDYATYNGTADAAVDSTDNTTYYSDEHTGVDSAYDSSVNSTNYTTDKTFL